MMCADQLDEGRTTLLTFDLSESCALAIICFVLGLERIAAKIKKMIRLVGKLFPGRHVNQKKKTKSEAFRALSAQDLGSIFEPLSSLPLTEAAIFPVLLYVHY